MGNGDTIVWLFGYDNTFQVMKNGQLVKKL